ncbi:Chaperone protein dnaJ A8, chloroplastic [Linum perenne]
MVVIRKGSLVYGMRTSPSLNPRSTVSHVSYVDKWFHLSLSLEEFVSGGERGIEVSSFETCEPCDKTGAKSNKCVRLCKACGSRGNVMKTARTPFRMMSGVI